MDFPRHCLVTGGSRGLGASLVRLLADRGHRTAYCARWPQDDRPHVPAFAGDLADPDFRARLITDVIDRLSTLDTLVLNAAVLDDPPLAPVSRLTSKSLTELLAVNLVAPLDLVRRFLPVLRRQENPLVLAISSDAARIPYSGWAAYAASKAGLEIAMEILAQEEPSIRVHVVDPGDMDTALHRQALPHDTNRLRHPDEAAAALLPLIENTVRFSGQIRLYLAVNSVGRLALVSSKEGAS
ncbi:MAG: SDR family NAD(P)-dependent oxidoreductase [Sulfobacillus sp.]|nr:SDR family NAD(P)-dependent oxidoreductase [Sulfobacillus sp.]